MNPLLRKSVAGALVILAVAAPAVHAQDDEFQDHFAAYTVTPLVSNLPKVAAMQDPVLQNAWGIAFSPAGSPFWVNDNQTGCSTLYKEQSAK